MDSYPPLDDRGGLSSSPDLGESSLVPRLVGVRGTEERPDESVGQLGSNDAGTQDEHVHVVVLDTLMGGVRIVAEPGPDAGQLVRRHRDPDARVAEQVPPLGLPLLEPRPIATA